MDNKEISKILYQLAQSLISNVELTLVKCRGCGFKDALTPSRLKRVIKSERGYLCDRCLNFLKYKHYEKFMKKNKKNDTLADDRADKQM